MDRNFEIQKKIPELFNNTNDIILKHGECLKTVTVEITAEGIYNGNGEYQDPKDMLFKIIGFDRSNGRMFWIGRGYIKEQQDNPKTNCF